MIHASNDIPASSLVDREKIRELKFTYCDALDHADIDALVSLFTPDAIYNLGKFGTYRGHEQIRELLAGLLATFSLTSHTPTVGKIEVRENEATAIWKALVAMQPMPSDGAAQPKLAFIDYYDKMVRHDRQWLFNEIALDFRGEWPIGA